MVQKAMEHQRRIAFGRPEEYELKITNRDLTPLPPDDDPGAAHGFNAAYVAWCNMRLVAAQPALMAFIDDLARVRLYLIFP